jgi:hypothetical protein
MDRIERAAKIKERLAEEHGVSVTAIVWMGGARFIVCKDGKEIRVETK